MSLFLICCCDSTTSLQRHWHAEGDLSVPTSDCYCINFLLPHVVVACTSVFARLSTIALQGGLSVNYSDNYYLLSQRHPDVPRLTQQHHEAMALFNEIASSDALRLDSMLQPGDIQLLNNHTQLHTRSKFEDFPVSPYPCLLLGMSVQDSRLDLLVQCAWVPCCSLVSQPHVC